MGFNADFPYNHYSDAGTLQNTDIFLISRSPHSGNTTFKTSMLSVENFIVANALNIGTGRVAFGYVAGGIISDSAFNYDISSKTLTVNHISALDATFMNNISAANLTGTNHGDLTTDVVVNAPNSTGMSLTFGSPSTAQILQLTPADATNPGVITSGTQTIGGNKTFNGTIAASNLSGTNHGDFTTGDVFFAPNSTGMFTTAGSSGSPQVLQLTPADSTNPGVMTATGSQIIGGNKQFVGTCTASNLSGTNHGDMTVSNIDGGAASPTGMNVTSGNSSTPQAISLNSASTGGPGLVNTAAQTFAGNKSFTGTVDASNILSGAILSGTNRGDLTIDALDNGPPSPTGINMILGGPGSNQSMSLCSAGSGTPGVVNNTTQTFAGTKTFNNPVGVGGSPNASAVLDCTSTTLGLGLPAMTTTQKNAISSPKAGLLVFDSTLSKACVYSGSAWQTITSV